MRNGSNQMNTLKRIVLSFSNILLAEIKKGKIKWVKNPCLVLKYIVELIICKEVVPFLFMLFLEENPIAQLRYRFQAWFVYFDKINY